MKRKSIISFLVFCMTLGMFTTSCEDMLSPDSERHSYHVAGDTLYSYWGILRSLQNVAERYVVLNEVRADLVSGTSFTSDTIAAIMNFGQNADPDKYKDGACAYLKVRDYYHVINSCNAYIASCDTMRRTGTNKQYMMREYAQVQAIRAWVYMQLIYAYGNVPFYTKPMLTTDEISGFMADKNHQMANASNLADLLAPDLERVEYPNIMDLIEIYPQYGYYGGSSNYVCHSTKCMFPVSVVLGDLYLLKGDDASCEKAAQHYYDYLKKEQAGPLSVVRYYSEGTLWEGEDDPQYRHVGIPFTQDGIIYRGEEAITCIPSSRGKLDGKVLTDISRLFGFTPSLRSYGSGEGSSASVNLSPSYERELVSSRGYEALCDSQKFEILIASGNGSNVTPQELVVLPDVGDARRSWTLDATSNGELNWWARQFTFRVGEDRFYGKMPNKMNPGIYYPSLCFPMVYRLSTVWLRFAEALNRAGFPSYAFAVLKTGLCNNSHWFPNVEEPGKTIYKYSERNISFSEYNIKDTLFAYTKPFALSADSTVTVSVGTDGSVESIDALRQAVESEYARIVEAWNADHPDAPVEAAEMDEKSVYYTAKTFENYADQYSPAPCYYLDRREVVKAQDTPFLNFNLTSFRGDMNQAFVPYKTDIYSKNDNTWNYKWQYYSNAEYVTIGVHQRGCGIMRVDDPINELTGEHESSYNYAKLVARKIKENHGVDVSHDDVYSGQYDEWVKEAVEDLIIDEMGLELAFEGTRFSDLCRVSLRRNDPTYLAKRVAKRNGEMDMNLYNYLSQDTKHWYLPFPQY